MRSLDKKTLFAAPSRCFLIMGSVQRWSKQRLITSSSHVFHESRIRDFFSQTFMLHCLESWKVFYPVMINSGHLSRFLDCLAHPNLSANLTFDQKWSLSCLGTYLGLKFSRVPFTIVLRSLINTMVDGTLLNFVKRYEGDCFKKMDTISYLQLWYDVVSVFMQQSLIRFGFAKQSKNIKRCIQYVWIASVTANLLRNFKDSARLLDK